MKLALYTFLFMQMLPGMVFAQSSQSTDNTNCDTNFVDISTGTNHIMNEMYPYSTPDSTVKDKYWLITKLPSNTLGLSPISCATIAEYNISATWLHTTEYGRGISFIANSDASVVGGPTGFYWQYDLGGCVPIDSSDDPIRFSRYFQIIGPDSQDVSIDISGFGDDIMFIAVDANEDNIYDMASTDPRIIYKDDCVSTTLVPISVTKTIRLAPGVHKLDVDCYDIAAIWVGVNLKGSITNLSSKLSKSTCFGISNCLEEPAPASVVQIELREQIKLYPNPSNGNLYLSNLNSFLGQELSIRILDIAGKNIQTNKIEVTKPTEQLNLSNIATGVYFVHILTQNNVSGTFKVHIR